MEMDFVSSLSSKERVKIGEFYSDVRRSLEAKGRPTIVLLHGIGVSGTYFLPFAELLAERFDVRVLDLPGYGNTPRPNHALSPTELAAVVAEYLQKLKVGPAVIIGQSMGCQTAARLALHYPSLCKKLILIGPTVNKWERSHFMQGIRLLQDTFHEPPRANWIIFSDYVHMGLFRYLKTSKYMFEDHLEEYVSGVAAPTFIVRGSNDVIAPRHWIAYLAEHMNNAEAIEVEGAPHVVQFVKPKELFEACEEFLLE